MRRNAGVVAGMLLMTIGLADIKWMESLRSGDIDVDGKPVAVGGHGMMAAMGAIAVCGQSLVSWDAGVVHEQVMMFTVGNLTMLTAYLVKWFVKSKLGARLVRMGYIAFGIGACLMAILGKRRMKRESMELKYGRIGLAVASWVFVVLGLADRRLHTMAYLGSTEYAANELEA